MSADWLASAGLGSVKPVVASLLLPPAPFIALALAGAWLARTRPRAARACVAAGCLGVWLSCSLGMAAWVERHCLDEPAALDAPGRDQLKARAAAREPLAIVVLGGGMTGNAPEYGSSDLADAPLSRLRYGAWLARQTGIPLAATGGTGWGSTDPGVLAEGTRMAQVAQAEFGVPLRWAETTSRDTHENAVNSVALLQAAGVRGIVLVTHGSHMPRALRAFRAAAAAEAASAPPIAIMAAPMGQSYPSSTGVLRWMPSGEGLRRMQTTLHEALAAVAEHR